MPDFEKMTPELSNLFLRLDAAAPTASVLRAAADLWQDRRGGSLAPQESLLEELPGEIRSHAFLVRASLDGQRQWTVSDAGEGARKLLAGDGRRLSDIRDVPFAQRLDALVDLVEQKGEPYAAMFELWTLSGLRQLCEVYVAPLSKTEEGAATLLAVLDIRMEDLK